MKNLLLFLMSLLLIACTSHQTHYPANQPSIRQLTTFINEIVIRNDSGDQLDQVKIKIKDIQGIFSCNQVLAGSTCLNTFPVQEYQGSPVIISWIQYYKPWTSGQLVLTLSSQFKPSLPLRALVVIGNDGQVSASMDQVEIES